MFVEVHGAPLLKLGLLPASPATLLSGHPQYCTCGGLSWSYLSAQVGRALPASGGLVTRQGVSRGYPSQLLASFSYLRFYLQ